MNLKIKLIVVFLIIHFTSCSNENKKDTLKKIPTDIMHPYTINSNMVQGQINDSLPFGIWSFKNVEGDDVLQIIFNQDLDSLESYSIKQFNSNGKVIFYGEYSTEGKNVEIDVTHYDNSNGFKVGGLLYETHIKNYVLLRKDYKKIYGSDRETYLNSILDSLQRNKIKYPVFQKEEVKAIINYLDELKKPTY